MSGLFFVFYCTVSHVCSREAVQSTLVFSGSYIFPSPVMWRWPSFYFACCSPVRALHFFIVWVSEASSGLIVLGCQLSVSDPGTSLNNATNPVAKQFIL